MNTFGFYVRPPNEDTPCNCTISEEPNYVMNILFNDYGVYLSQRIQPEKEMYNLLQAPEGKVEESEDFIEAAWRETWEETGIDCDENDMKFILNDLEYNCDMYITRIPPA